MRGICEGCGKSSEGTFCIKCSFRFKSCDKCGRLVYKGVSLCAECEREWDRL